MVGWDGKRDMHLAALARELLLVVIGSVIDDIEPLGEHRCCLGGRSNLAGMGAGVEDRHDKQQQRGDGSEHPRCASHYCLPDAHPGCIARLIGLVSMKWPGLIPLSQANKGEADTFRTGIREYGPQRQIAPGGANKSVLGKSTASLSPRRRRLTSIG